jgi:putative addiction module antidote
MVALKVVQVGSSAGVILPKEVLAALNVEKGDLLHFTREPDGSMRITPHDPEFAKQLAILEEVIDRDRELLAELAKR